MEPAFVSGRSGITVENRTIPAGRGVALNEPLHQTSPKKNLGDCVSECGYLFVFIANFAGES
ncbi:hypothetical protein DEV91_10480 [Phyllobacterium brassicacearum]|nr:hypothetical protein DEV91_10480 [Phyllobacterium brassicacearum]